MEYRKFRAPTLKEARIKLLLELGNNAYIVDQKVIKEGGILGMMGKPMVEITAAIIPEEMKRKAREEAQKKKEMPQAEIEEHGWDDKQKEENERSKRDLIRILEDNKQLKNFLIENRSLPKDSKHESNGETFEPNAKPGVRSSKESFSIDPTASMGGSNEQNYSGAADGESGIPVFDGNASGVSMRTYSQTSFKKEENRINFLKMILQNQDFDDTFIEKFVQKTDVDDTIFSPNHIEYLKKLIATTLDHFVHTQNGVSIKENEPNALMVVGPTGVGKTTILAKLGAYFGIFQKKKVKFISIDNYRVGAAQQLKLYADIMEIPFQKANSLQEFQSIMLEEGFDLYLIDTAGRSPNNIEEVKEIKEYIKNIPYNTLISLVVSATTKYRDLIHIFDVFDMLEYSNVIASKMDETNTVGQLISAIGTRKSTLSYISYGQKVPEDISGASSSKLVDLVMKK